MKYETAVKRISKLENERSELFLKLKPIQDRLIAIHTELETLYETRDAVEVSALNGEFSIDLMLTGIHKSLSKHQEAERQIHKLGLYRNGYWASTLQACIQVKLTLYNLQQTYDGIMFLLPYIKVFSGINVDKIFRGKKVFGIFEHTLSSNGIYKFVISDDGTSCVVVTRYYRTTVEERFPTIMHGLKYIQKFHYYENENDDTHGDD